MLIDSKELAENIGNVLDNKKGKDILLLNIQNVSIIADYFVICSGRSTIQVKALSDEVEEKIQELGVPLLRKEGYRDGRWIVMDYGTVIVHLFHHDDRHFYNLEHLWADGEKHYISQ